MTLLEALLCFALTFAVLWACWRRFFEAPPAPGKADVEWADLETIRDRMRSVEPPLYTKRSWKN